MTSLPSWSDRSITPSRPSIGSGTSLRASSSNVRPGKGTVTPGSTVLKIAKREISNVVGPSSFCASISTTCARSSPLRNSPPKGQPEPTIRSQVMSSFFASSKVAFSASIHSSLSHVSERLPMSLSSSAIPIGLISTPPIPAAFMTRSSRRNSSGSTLSPFHHQRTNGR